MKRDAFFSKTVTVYNRVAAADGEVWRPVVLDGVCWQEVKANGVTAMPDRRVRAGRIYIPVCVESRGKAHCPPDLFDRLGAEASAWTLRPGDVVCSGEEPLGCEGSLPRAQGGQSRYVITAVSVHNAPDGLAHWEVKVQ